MTNSKAFPLNYPYTKQSVLVATGIWSMINAYPIWKYEDTPPKFNIDPEQWWLEDDPFLLGFGTFSGVNC